MSGNFNWAHKANTRLTGYEIGKDSWQAEAEHDGYLEKFGIRHRLRVQPATGFSVEDSPLGRGVAIGFLLHSSLHAASGGQTVRVTRDGKMILRLLQTGGLTCRIDAPDSPTSGWCSETFGIKTATTRIVFFGAMTAN